MNLFGDDEYGQWLKMVQEKSAQIVAYFRGYFDVCYGPEFRSECMRWFGNPWVIGILGSVPGGFFVSWLSKVVLGRRENREYLQKVIGANREVVNAIRPGISEGHIPTSEVLISLLNATARRYAVEPNDLYTPAQIAEELVKEVMDSSFISSAQKAEYCSKLAVLGARGKSESVEVEKREVPMAIAEHRRRSVSAMSMFLGLLTVSMTVMYSMVGILQSRRLDILAGTNNVKNFYVLLPTLAALATIMLTLVVFLWYTDLLRRRTETKGKGGIVGVKIVTRKGHKAGEEKPSE